MGKILAFCCLILSVLAVRAQSPPAKKQPRWFAGLTTGPSIPLGKFAAKDAYDDRDGLARPGPALELMAGYFFHPRVGVQFLAGGQMNPQDADAYGRWLKLQYGSTVQYSVQSKSWNILRLMAGPVFDLPLSSKGPVALRVKLLAGVLKTSLPGYSYTASVPPSSSFSGFSGYYRINSSVGLPWTFSYQAEAGVRWRLTRQIDLVGNVGWFQAQPVHKYNFPISASDLYMGAVVTGSLMPVAYVEMKQKIPISELHVQTGVEVRF